MDGTMLKRMRGTPAVVVGLHTTIEIPCRTYVETVVGAAKDVDVVHSPKGTVRFCRRIS